MYLNQIHRTKYYSKANPPKIGDHAIPHHDLGPISDHVIEIIEKQHSGFKDRMVYLIRVIYSIDINFPLHHTGWKDEDVLFRYYSSVKRINYNNIWDTLNG